MYFWTFCSINLEIVSTVAFLKFQTKFLNIPRKLNGGFVWFSNVKFVFEAMRHYFDVSKYIK